MMFSPQKLHPISYVTDFVRSLKSNIFPLIIGLFSLFSNGLDNFWDAIFPLSILSISFIYSIYNSIKIYNTRYWIEDDQLIMVWGVFSKNRKELNIERIQSVDTSQNIIHQLLGGVNLSVKTASDGIELDTITKKQSEELSNYLKKRKTILENSKDTHADSQTFESTEHIIRDESDELEIETDAALFFKLSNIDLLKMSFTSGGILIVFAAIGSLYGFSTQFIDVSGYITPLIDKVINLTTAIIFIGLIGLILSYIIGSFIVFIKNYKYQLTFDGELLVVKYGLFTVQKRTVPIKRIQALKEEQSLFRKLIGYTKISAIITTDGHFDNLDEDHVGNVTILPFIKKKDAFQLLEQIVPQFKFESVNQGLPLQGIRRRVFVPSILIILITIPIQIYLWSYSWIIALGLILIGIGYASVITLKSGYKVNNQFISILMATPFAYETIWVNKEKILTLQLNENPIIKRKNIAHFNIQIAYGNTQMTKGLKFVKKKDVLSIYDWYNEKEVEINASNT
ncbi:PH domain-containing protein [Mammaliicoccus stepanovicii]|nr:PH domain-containing protein [Mammaliicoccus stepanovicii]PNZ78951.1 hypothetical protein CD111_01985 [Mammaliicoccus stepanovicii]